MGARCLVMQPGLRVELDRDLGHASRIVERARRHRALRAAQGSVGAGDRRIGIVGPRDEAVDHRAVGRDER